MDYLIGDTIRLKATIKSLAGTESAPVASPTLSVYDMDETELLSSGTSSLTGGTTAQYYYDWKVPVTLTADANLNVVWSWDDTHKARMTFSVITVLS